MVIVNSYPMVVIDDFEVWGMSMDSHLKMYTEDLVKDCLNTIRFIKRK